jgi:hypothetical protein
MYKDEAIGLTLVLNVRHNDECGGTLTASACTVFGRKHGEVRVTCDRCGVQQLGSIETGRVE